MHKLELLSKLEPILDTESAYLNSEWRSSTPAAVLVILHYHRATSEPRVILTRRSANLKTHKSEISFPGGRLADEDEGDAMRAAVRETREEIGLSFDPRDILGALKSVSTMTSNHIIIPFVIVRDRIGEHRMSPEEVEEIIDIPLIETLRSMKGDPGHYGLAKDACQFAHGKNVIWGATARILRQLYDVLIRPS